jgi:hypothetical protein
MQALQVRSGTSQRQLSPWPRSFPFAKSLPGAMAKRAALAGLSPITSRSRRGRLLHQFIDNEVDHSIAALFQPHPLAGGMGCKVEFSCRRYVNTSRETLTLFRRSRAKRYHLSARGTGRMDDFGAR